MADELSPDDLQTLQQVHQHLLASGDPRAPLLTKYLSSSGLPMTGAYQPDINKAFDYPNRNPADSNLMDASKMAWEAKYGFPPPADIGTGIPGGGSEMSVPSAMLAGAGLISNPASTVTGLATAGAAHKGAKMLGAPDWGADLAGAVGGVVGGVGASRIGSAIQGLSDSDASLLPFGKLAKRYLTHLADKNTVPVYGPTTSFTASKPGVGEPVVGDTTSFSTGPVQPVTGPTSSFTATNSKFPRPISTEDSLSNVKSFLQPVGNGELAQPGGIPPVKPAGDTATLTLPRSQVNAGLHVHAQELNLPGYPAGVKATPDIRLAVKSNFGHNSIADASAAELQKIDDYLMTHKILPTAGQLKPK